MRNLRDALEHAGDAGERLRRRMLWRGDAPVDLDAPSRRRLEALELRTVVDLRRDRERAERPYDPSAFAERSVSISLVGESRPPVSFRGGFEPFNRWVLGARGPELAEVVSALARPGALPALVHCTAGKDRTGVVIALVQAWLGVPDPAIAEDYSLSAENLRAYTDEAIEQQRIALGVDARERPELLEARPEWIAGALVWLRAAYGSPERYLLAHGVRAEELESLRRVLVVDAGVAV